MKPGLRVFLASASLSIVSLPAILAKDVRGPADETVLQNDGGPPRVVGLWLMGQSLCEGSESLPLVTSKDSGHGNYSFQRGVRTWIAGDHNASPEDRPADQFGFVPLTAGVYGGLGETIANGLADHLTATLAKADKRTATLVPPFLVAYAGQGGRTIEELSKADESTDNRTPPVKKGGGGFYKTSLDDARRATKQARSLGKEFHVGALVWMQGEANGGARGGIVPSRWLPELPPPAGQEWYRDRLIAYRKQWSNDLRTITGQEAGIPMFTYQTQGPAGDAQLMAADADPGIYMVGPHYMVPSALNSRRPGGHGAAIHLSADGQRWYGEQAAKVIHRVLNESEDWQPLRPKKAVIDPSRMSVLVDFAVPRPPLVLDEAFFPRQQSVLGSGFSSLGGFRIHSKTGALIPLASVTADSPARLRITLTAPLPDDARCTVSYGLPYAGDIGTIASIRSGPALDGQPTTELQIRGTWPARLNPLLAEGAFYIANQMTGTAFAQAPVRHVNSDKDSFTLRFEDRERRNNIDFAPGQPLVALRPFSYGNLRDSDSETAVCSFGDNEYGSRAGRPYPLWNWCVLFNDFPVSER